MQIKQVFTAQNAHDTDHRGQFRHCPFCGAPLESRMKGGRTRPSCPECGFVQFRNPAPGVVVVIEKDGKVLLGRRRGGFGKGKWGLPQGYIEFDENFLTAAIREVKEETGLDVEVHSILNVVSNQLTPELHTLAIVLLAHVVAGEPSAGDDVDVLQWASLSEPLPDMAFEADRIIIERYRKVDYRKGLPIDPDFTRSDKR